MPFRFERIARRNFADVPTSDALHAVQVDKGSLAARAHRWRHLEVSQVRHPMSRMNRQSLALHPAHVAGFLIYGRDIHDSPLVCSTSPDAGSSIRCPARHKPIRWIGAKYILWN